MKLTQRPSGLLIPSEPKPPEKPPVRSSLIGPFYPSMPCPNCFAEETACDQIVHPPALTPPNDIAIMFYCACKWRAAYAYHRASKTLGERLPDRDYEFYT